MRHERWPAFSGSALVNRRPVEADTLHSPTAQRLLSNKITRTGGKSVSNCRIAACLSTIFMRAILKAHGVTDRTVWVADSFEGLPAIKPKDALYAEDAIDVAGMNEGGPLQLGLAVPLDRVKQNFAKFDLLDDQVRFLKGWFSDTLPTAPINKLAILRLDGDMYQSTMDALNALYSKGSKGGYVIVDDYNCWPHCKQAVDDFRKTHGIREEIIEIDKYGVFWKVSASDNHLHNWNNHAPKDQGPIVAFAFRGLPNNYWAAAKPPANSEPRTTFVPPDNTSGCFDCCDGATRGAWHGQGSLRP